MASLQDVEAGNVEMPLCDFHRLYGQRMFAEYFGVTTEGFTGYMCDNCFQDYGIGLGGPLGYKLDERISE